jgi:tetratricopeptide (TPR) repeat protein
MKLKIVSLVYLLLVASFASGQTNFRVKKLDADSLASLIPGKKDTEKIDALNLLSKVICKVNIDSSINLSNQAIRLSEKLEYKKGLADGYFNLGDYYYMLDSLEPTISNYLKALRFYEDLGPSLEYGNLLMQLGWINFYKNRFEYAYKYMILAKSIFERIDNDELVAYASFGLGRAKTVFGEHDSAIYYINKSLLVDSVEHGESWAWGYFGLDIIYFNQFDESKDTTYLRLGISMLEKALKCPKIDDDLKVIIYIGIAIDYITFNTDKHISYGIEYLEMASRLADSSIQAYEHKDEILRCLAWTYNMQGDYDRAVKLCEQSIRFTEERMAAFTIDQHPEPLIALNNKLSHRMTKVWVYECMYDTYTKLGEYKKAHEYFVLSQEAEKEISQEKNRNLMTMMEADSKDEKAKSQIELLARDNDLKALAIKQSRTFNFGIAGIFVFLLLVGLLLLRQNKMKAKHNTVLLEQKLLRSQMNPHFIFNSLANIQDFIWNKDPLTANEYLSSFSKLVRLILENSRNDFVPVEKEINTIENYLNLQKLRYRDKFEYTIEIDPEIDEEDMLIPPMLVQPFIENSIEHGIRLKETTGHIQVRFYLQGDQINIEVKDDGIGFKKSTELKKDRKKDHQSLAMTITQERLLMHYKKYKRKIQLTISDLMDDNNQVTGAQVVFGIPYNQG